MLPEDQQKIREQITNGTEYFLFVGSIHPRKNVQRLIEAYAICRKEHPNIKLVIAGGLAWKNKAIHKAISIIDNPEDIQFTGYLPSHQLAQIMASAKALVFPSIFEGFGIPVLEAMQCGIPVITSENSAMSEVAGPNNARFINPFDTKSIANAMMDVCQSNTRNTLHGKQGVLRAKEFSWDKSVAIVENVLFG